MRLRFFAALPFVLAFLFQALPASAHARYEGSTPADGAAVGSPPSQVEAEFSEPVTSDSYLQVTDPCGAIVSGDSNPFADRVSVSMNGSRAGTYTVYYRVQSSVDSHVTDGTFSFSSSGGEPCPGQKAPAGGSGGGQDPSDGGGGGNPGGSADPGADDAADGGSDEAAGSSVDETGSSSSESEVAQSQNGGNHGGKHGEDRSSSGSKDRQTEVELALQNEERERKGPDPWDLPRDGLIAGLTIAALIGAAGGRIYASIIGPRD